MVAFANQSSVARNVRTRKSGKATSGFSPLAVVVAMALVVVTCATTSVTYVGNADKFTDIFYTNSFRGAFEWIQKLDWVGMIVQMVISCFSLFGVALMTIRIMTSMLYLSSKGLWEEVHDLKQSTGESELYDFGFLNMAKSWAKGKAGTGLDAIIGAVLILLPDVKKYSDFGEKASGDMDENMTISQYMLKIALPTIMTVFFFAMGFNGTLFQALAVTVDAMGTAADKAISINYAGFIEDLVNSGTGYKFLFTATGTNEGKFQQNIAKDIYGRAVSEMPSADAEQLYVLGKNVELLVGHYFTTGNMGDANSASIAETVKNGLRGDAENATPDAFVNYLGYEIIVNGSAGATGEFLCIPIQTVLFEGSGQVTGSAANGSAGNSDYDPGSISAVPRHSANYTEDQTKYMHIFVRQTSNFNGSYFNLDGTAANDQH